MFLNIFFSIWECFSSTCGGLRAMMFNILVFPFKWGTIIADYSRKCLNDWTFHKQQTGSEWDHPTSERSNLSPSFTSNCPKLTHSATLTHPGGPAEWRRQWYFHKSINSSFSNQCQISPSTSSAGSRLHIKAAVDRCEIIVVASPY